MFFFVFELRRDWLESVVTTLRLPPPASQSEVGTALVLVITIGIASLSYRFFAAALPKVQRKIYICALTSGVALALAMNG